MKYAVLYAGLCLVFLFAVISLPFTEVAPIIGQERWLVLAAIGAGGLLTIYTIAVRRRWHQRMLRLKADRLAADIAAFLGMLLLVWLALVLLLA